MAREPTDAEVAAKAEVGHLEEELKHRRNSRLAQTATIDTSRLRGQDGELETLVRHMA